MENLTEQETSKLTEISSIGKAKGSNGNDEQPINISISIDEDILATAIERGVYHAIEDVTKHVKKQTKLFMFIFSGILLMLAIIAISIASYHNSLPMPH